MVFETVGKNGVDTELAKSQLELIVAAIRHCRCHQQSASFVDIVKMVEEALKLAGATE
jgi:hypothetical protein